MSSWDVEAFHVPSAFNGYITIFIKFFMLFKVFRSVFPPPCFSGTGFILKYRNWWWWEYQVMAMELGAYKIRVNSISPGLFKSEITQGLMQKDWLSNVALKTVPLRTFGTADPALTSLARYLIHDSSEYVTGNNFIVDAGATLPGVPLFSSLWNWMYPHYLLVWAFRCLLHGVCQWRIFSLRLLKYFHVIFFFSEDEFSFFDAFFCKVR